MARQGFNLFGKRALRTFVGAWVGNAVYDGFIADRFVRVNEGAFDLDDVVRAISVVGGVMVAGMVIR